MVRPTAGKTIRHSPSKHARKQFTPVKKVHKPVHILSRLRKQKRDGEYLIPWAPFARIVKEIMTDMSLNFQNQDNYFKIQRFALDALKISAEAYLIQLFEDMSLLVNHAKRKTCMVQDFQLVKRLRASYGDQVMMAVQSENGRY
uniref:Histone H2A/H2B/H3 domain-containing protein n=1 Tax=Panagrolaimus sp. PS1159 TaxID=55785 RepID=A0AC35G1B9_9BILA